jgi:hypothetical protein
MATYIPVLGSFEAPFSIVNGNDIAVARDADPAFQGPIRPGVLKWLFQLIVPDATAAGDDQYTLAVPCPYVFTADDVGANENSFWPHVCMCALDSDSSGQGAGIYVDTGEGADWNVTDQTIPVVIVLSTPTANESKFNVIIDFSHTSIS